MSLKAHIAQLISEHLQTESAGSNSDTFAAHSKAAHAYIRSKMKSATLAGHPYSEESKDVIMKLPEHQDEIRRRASSTFISHLLKPLSKELRSKGGEITVRPDSHLQLSGDGLGPHAKVDSIVGINHDDDSVHNHYREKAKDILKKNGYSHVDSPLKSQYWRQQIGFVKDE